jgi:hypothetical protein
MKRCIVALFAFTLGLFAFAQPPTTLINGIVWQAAPWPNEGIDFMISSGFPPGFKRGGDPCNPPTNMFSYGFCGQDSLTRDFEISHNGGTGNYSFTGTVGISTTTQLDGDCWLTGFKVTNGTLVGFNVKTLNGDALADMNMTGLTAQYSQMWCSVNGADRWTGGELTVETP